MSDEYTNEQMAKACERMAETTLRDDVYRTLRAAAATLRAMQVREQKEQSKGGDAHEPEHGSDDLVAGDAHPHKHAQAADPPPPDALLARTDAMLEAWYDGKRLPESTGILLQQLRDRIAADAEELASWRKHLPPDYSDSMYLAKPARP